MCHGQLYDSYELHTTSMCTHNTCVCKNVTHTQLKLLSPKQLIKVQPSPRLLLTGSKFDEHV